MKAMSAEECEALLALSAERLGMTCWRCRGLSPPGSEHLVAEYALHDARTHEVRRRVIAKWYGDDAGERTFALMQRLSGLLQEHRVRAPLALPRALAYDPALKLLLQERAAGARYAELMTRSTWRHYLRRAGKALAQLHRLPPPAAPPRRMEHHVAELMRPHPLRLAEGVPHMEKRVLAVLAELVRLENARPRAAAAAWLHRDFHLKQLLHGRGRVWVIDWDLAAHGDPALDVGNFALNLRKHLRECAPAGRAAFLEGYFEAGDAEVASRIPLYEAFNCLRRACKAFRTRHARWQRDLERRVAAAEEALSRM